MEECFAGSEEEWRVAYLRSVHRWVIDLAHTAGIECLPHSAGGRIRVSHCDLGAVCPPRLDTWTTRCATCQFVCRSDLFCAVAPGSSSFAFAHQSRPLRRRLRPSASS